MSSPARLRDIPSYTTDQKILAFPPESMEKEQDTWRLKLSLQQLIIVWAIIAGCMLGAFLLGFYSGRDEGLSIALEKTALDSVRLPVIENLQEETAGGGFQVEFSPKNTASNIINNAPEDSNKLPKAENKTNIDEQNYHKNIENLVKNKEIVSTLTAVSKLESGWYVQIVAARTEEEANQVVTKLKASNYSNILLEKVEIGKKTYFRIVSGPYSEKNTAELIKKEILLLKLIKGEPFVKFVK